MLRLSHFSAMGFGRRQVRILFALRASRRLLASSPTACRKGDYPALRLLSSHKQCLVPKIRPAGEISAHRQDTTPSLYAIQSTYSSAFCVNLGGVGCLGAISVVGFVAWPQTARVLATTRACLVSVLAEGPENGFLGLVRADSLASANSLNWAIDMRCLPRIL